jgi:hypothetical protein
MRTAMNAPIREFDPELTSRRPASWQERAEIAYPLLILLGILLVVPANFGPPLLHDSFEIDWVWADQFTAELARGNLYPRWLPLSNAGLGSSVFYYYPPLSFYVSGLFGIAGMSTYGSVIATFAAGFVASGIGCWHWLKGRASQPLLGAVLFMAAPYHLFDFTVRGAQAESFAIAFIPLIAIGLRRIREERGGILFTAIAYAGIVFTHLPLALLVSVFLIGPYALLHWRKLPRFAAAVAAGLGLVAIYLIPALALAPYHDVNQLYRMVDLRTDYWNIYAVDWHRSYVIVVFSIMGAIIAASLYPVLRRRDGWAAYAIAIAILVAGVVPMLWALPILKQVQFPYRGLPLAEFALATALARLPAKPILPFLLAGLALLMSARILPGFHIGEPAISSLSGHHPDVYEYLPRGVIEPGRTREKLSEVTGPRLPPPRVPGMVVEPVFYFPAWSCGEPEPRTQLLMHRPDCRPHLIWTTPERIGGAISACFALLLLAFGIGGRAARRKALAG